MDPCDYPGGQYKKVHGKLSIWIFNRVTMPGDGLIPQGSLFSLDAEHPNPTSSPFPGGA